MSATFLADFPGHVAAELSELLPRLRECRAVPGRFDLSRLLSEGIRAPAVLVSLLRIREDASYAGPHHGYLLQMGAFVVTKDQMGLPHAVAAATVAQAVAARVRGARWNEDLCDLSRDLRIEPIVTAATEKAAASLWAVTWSQPAVFEPIDPGAPVPIELYVSTVPEVGAAHEDDYDRVGGEP